MSPVNHRDLWEAECNRRNSAKSSRSFARPRTVEVGKDGRNKMETRYETEILKPRLYTNQVLSYQFEGLKLRLAKKTFYTPDYVVVTPVCIELHEVKGFWEDDARVKIKVAAAQFPYFKFVAVQYKKSTWTYEYF